MLAAFAVTGGSGAGFLLLALAGVAGGELDPVGWSGNLDTMFRQSVASSAISIGISLGIGALAQGAYRMLFVRQLARAAEADPRQVVAWSTRRLLLLSSPFLGTYIYGFYFLVMGIIAIIINAMVVSTGESDVAATILIGEVAVWLLMAVLLLVVWRAGEPAWKGVQARASEAWGLGGRRPMREQQQDERRTDGDVRALRRAARRIVIVGTVAGVIGGGTFMIAVSLRQPCRRGCDRRTYPEPGERAIDAIVAVAIPFTVVAVLAAVLALVVLWLSSVLEASSAVSLPEAPGHEALDRLLNGWWPGTTAGLAMVVVGWGFAPVLAGAHLAVPGILPSALIPTLIGVGAVGAVVLWWAEGAAARSRNRLREAWSLGDIVSRPTPNRRTPARNRKRAAR